MASQEICLLCDEVITSDRSMLTKKGIDAIIKISADLKDGVDQKMLKLTPPIAAHASCTTNYRKPSNIRKRKRIAMENDDDGEVNKYTCRSQVSAFNIKTDCVYCGLYMDTESISRQRLHQRDPMHKAETTELLASIISKSLSRNDEWGKEVHIRVQNVGDLVAAEAQYHHQCQVRFHSGRCVENKPKGRPSGSVNDIKQQAFEKLCEHIDSSDVHQYSIIDLEELVGKFSDSEEHYSAKHLKRKLTEHYGDSLIVTCENGKDTIYTFLDEANRILRNNYKATGRTPEDIVDMAATLIEDQIRSIIYDDSHFPKFSDLINSGNMVSPLLLTGVKAVVTIDKIQ